MKKERHEINRICVYVLSCLIALAGCGNVAGTSESSSAEETTEETTEQPWAAYEAFLAGDIFLFDSKETDKWGLDAWKDTILLYGGLEYTYLDLDGDGVEELLVQYMDDPCTFNGVFHYDDGRLSCWQFDCVEAVCRDYPLWDGTMVRQYDYGGTRSYQLFRYQANGEEEMFSSLYAREERIDPNSTDPCPYYEVDGEEVDHAVFEERLKELVTDRMPDRSVWTEL